VQKTDYHGFMYCLTFIKSGILEKNICDIWQWCIYWWSPESI